jgi:hypothetical protein
MDDQHHQGFELTDTNHALLTVVIALILKQNHRPAENLFGISEIKAMLCQVGLPFGFVPSEIHGLDYADKNTHCNSLNISCHPAFGHGRVPTSPICGAGAENTVIGSGVYTATLSAVSLRPEFHVLDVKVLPIRKDGSTAEPVFSPPSRPFCVSEKHPEWFSKSRSGATMTTVNTPATPICGNPGYLPTIPRYTITKQPVLQVIPIDQVTAIARHQHIANAISTASWHLRHGRVEQATGRILSAARHLKQACTESTTSGRA